MKLTMYLAASTLALCAAPASAAIVTNGNFEANSGVPTGWTVSSGTDISAFAAGAYIPCCGISGTPAELANTIASFGAGNVANVSTLNQIISTIAGNVYTLTFDYAVFGGGSQTIFANVLNGMATIASTSVTQSANANLATTFTSQSLSFTATGSSTTLSFNVDGVTNSVDGILDNVAVVTAVPESATWMMIIIGFGVAGSTLRYRRRRNAVSFG